jgi:DNA polymerase II small subunit/DNA polymerase delta subunit B
MSLLTEADNKRAENFKKELSELLKKYKAEIELEEETSGNAYIRGQDQMVVTFESEYDKNNNLIRSSQEVVLGRWLYSE